MPNWSDILAEINNANPTDGGSPLDFIRRKYLRELYEYTGRNTIAYYSGFLSKPREAGVEINDEDKNGFMLCIHEMDRSKGLDILIHTPGGSIAATESLVHYLYEMFGHDIRAIVPQIAMSAGTMIACACKSIVMGKHSNLGPCDPQIDGLPAIAVKRQFEEAFAQIVSDDRSAAAWSPILRQLGPSFLKECDWAIEWAAQFVRDSLNANMLKDDPNALVKADEISKAMTAELHKGHDKHIHYQDCIGMGLNIEVLENDQNLQNLVLTVHHCFMHTLSNTTAIKAIENHTGKGYFKMIAPPLPTFNLSPTA